MKKTFLFATVLMVSLVMVRCSKSNGSLHTSTAGSQWTIDGKTYKGLATTYDDSSSSSLGVITSSDAAGNNITVVFGLHVTASGVYTVTNGSLTGSSSCLISAGVFSGGTYNLYTSTGKSGDKVTVTVTGGKLQASFTNVTIGDNTRSTTVTGTVMQE